ncbi:MAG TPA: hypothetical protein PK850_07780 [Ignavibacteria bacterium]|nr:hypothetical protein [Ignavibacteria bacterium]HRF65843.1 hypothetical protein [Ignavibacteria bacterium]
MQLSDILSIVSIVVSIICAGYTINIKKKINQHIKGDNNIQAGKNVKI